MLFNSSALVAALSLHTAFAAPAMEHKEHHLEDIQCRCLTFRANERPTPCNFFESRGFDWRSAQILASQYDIKVQFASKSTISKVLSISAPLPSEVLQTTNTGDAQSASRDANISQNKIVCGFGKEVRRMSHHYRDYEPESHFVGQVIGWLMLFIALYVVGEYVWTRYSSRSRPIKLKGEEKHLRARFSNTTSSKDAPSDFS
ncbi:hypothetical protein BU25DRAFT_80198 [Macroventuria anomochaeta]|uniref:Uncharacterized protein n=1 Tax=Macroventuria anomochaeta TaxID=301207 RepID=A0ACB6SHW0_9PLEO|nr:uncharacterized protein BU25DRAFT_80198 [Macroventuria anomochaeta]KAF2632677.1 hypothetical protein BU25DRAFT_80198 [Macroventuria anomochaeta]